LLSHKLLGFVHWPSNRGSKKAKNVIPVERTVSLFYGVWIRVPAGGGGGIETFVPCASERFVLVWFVRWYEFKKKLLLVIFSRVVGLVSFFILHHLKLPAIIDRFNTSNLSRFLKGK
jgi:hypothetical protein